MNALIRPAQPRGILAVRAEAPTPDIKATIDQLNRAFEAFKGTQDDKLKGIEARFDDVVTTAKAKKISSEVQTLQTAVDAVNARLAAASLGGASSPLRDAEYTEAFRAWFRKGSEVHASLNKGADAEGGYLAPVEWDRTIGDKLIEVSPMRQIATVQAISGAGFRKLYNLRGTVSGWVGEAAARVETATATFGSLDFIPGELYANPAATQQMLDDAEVNLEQWLAGEVETEFSFREGLAFIAGDGVNKPFGFLTYATGQANAARHPFGAIETRVAAAAAAVTDAELTALIHLLPSAFTQAATWVMNRATIGEVMNLRDADGRSLWQPSTAAGQPPTLKGFAVTEMPGMPDIAANALPIAFGDFGRGYLIVDRTGVRVLRDPFTNKPNVMFYTTKRVGGGVNNPETIKVLQMAAV